MMEHSLNQMKQSISQSTSALSQLAGANFLTPSHAGTINPLSGADPLYDAPPATPVYHADDECAQPNNPNRSVTPKSEPRDSITKISSEDLLNFQASSEAQALMLNTLLQGNLDKHIKLVQRIKHIPQERTAPDRHRVL